MLSLLSPDSPAIAAAPVLLTPSSQISKCAMQPRMRRDDTNHFVTDVTARRLPSGAW